MPRVLIVATTSFAGMGPYVSEIVNNFTVDDDVFYFFHDYEDDFFLKNIKKELHCKSLFVKRKNSKWSKLRSLLPLKSVDHDAIISCCKKNSIRLVHFINNPASVRIVKDLKKLGIAAVSTVHDLHPHEQKKAWYKELRFKIIYARLYDNLLKGKFFITNSKSQYDEMASCYPDKKLFFHSFPSLVSEKIILGKESPQELANVNKPYILFFGRIEEYKGIALLYEAFTQCSQLNESYNLVIAGSGTLPFSRVENERNVIMINRYIKDDEVAELYKNARAVVYPYISATQSGVLSLAYYFGVPTLASDVPFFKGCIEKSGAGMLFRNGDTDDLKEKLLSLLDDDNEIMKVKEREFYHSNYDGAAIRENLFDIYNQVANNE